MGKRQSYDVAGAVHELTFSTYRNMPVLSLPQCAEIVVQEIFNAKHRIGFQVPAYVIMPTHVHLLIFPSENRYSVPKILFGIKKLSSRRILEFLSNEAPELRQRLNVSVKGKPVGRVWQAGGGYDRVFTEIKSLQSAVEYIHNNPVKAGLCSNQSEYAFSSAKAMEEGDFSLLDPLPYY